MSRALVDRIVEARVRQVMNKPGFSGTWGEAKEQVIAEINALSNVDLLDIISMHIREA